MKKLVILPLAIIYIFLFTIQLNAQGIIVDHNSTNITKIPEEAINQAKATLHIGYGHTSHGSQLVDGMTGLVGFANNGGLGLSLPTDIFKWNNGGIDGALDLEEGAGYNSGWLELDCGDYPKWVDETREYLDDASHADVNIIIWSWCGEASSYTEKDMIDKYLTPMSQLEKEYPNVTFVYMTGHSDGTGEEGILHIRNQQIRQFCIDSNKVLYDFYDIECYDPDNNYYGDKLVNDACDYDSDGDGTRDKNWAIDWQNSHRQDVDWYNCGSVHSQPLNANRKAYAAWWLWACVAGWAGDEPLPVEMTSFTATAADKKVILKWQTASEINNIGYIVYKSIFEENSGYEEIASYKYYNELKGAGTASTNNVYTFTDNKVNNGRTYWYKIADEDINGHKTYHGPVSAIPMEGKDDIITINVPTNWLLKQNYPNPFNPVTKIKFDVPVTGDNTNIQINVYDMQGEKIKTIISEAFTPGSYQVEWDGTNVQGDPVASGIYIYRLESIKFFQTKKMIIIR